MPVIPALWEAEAGGSLEASILRPAWAIWGDPISKKKIKVGLAQWLKPIIPALGKLRWADLEVKSLRPAWPAW